MANNSPLVPARTLTVQPDANATVKDQKRYQLPDDYNAQQTNQALDQTHERINKIVVEAAALADLSILATGSTLVQAVAAIQVAQARINAFGAILRQSGLLKSS